MKSSWGIGLLLAFFCAFGSNADVSVRAMRILWTQEMEMVEAAAPAHTHCHVVDLGRVRAAARALDTISKLQVSDDIHWEYVPLDRAEVQRAITRWSDWFERNHKSLRMDVVVKAIEYARQADQSQIVP